MDICLVNQTHLLGYLCLKHPEAKMDTFKLLHQKLLLLSLSLSPQNLPSSGKTTKISCELHQISLSCTISIHLRRHFKLCHGTTPNLSSSKHRTTTVAPSETLQSEDQFDHLHQHHHDHLDDLQCLGHESRWSCQGVGPVQRAVEGKGFLGLATRRERSKKEMVQAEECNKMCPWLLTSYTGFLLLTPNCFKLGSNSIHITILPSVLGPCHFFSRPTWINRHQPSGTAHDLASFYHLEHLEQQQQPGDPAGKKIRLRKTKGLPSDIQTSNEATT